MQLPITNNTKSRPPTPSPATRRPAQQPDETDDQPSNDKSIFVRNSLLVCFIFDIGMIYGSCKYSSKTTIVTHEYLRSATQSYQCTCTVTVSQHKSQCLSPQHPQQTTVCDLANTLFFCFSLFSFPCPT